jgi:hypothetical protein
MHDDRVWPTGGESKFRRVKTQQGSEAEAFVQIEGPKLGGPSGRHFRCRQHSLTCDLE